MVHEVNHYCVPNMTANTPRVSSRALSMGALRFLIQMGAEGVDGALLGDPGLARGAYLYRGRAVNEAAAGALGLEYADLATLLAERADMREG